MPAVSQANWRLDHHPREHRPVAALRKMQRAKALEILAAMEIKSQLVEGQKDGRKGKKAQEASEKWGSKVGWWGERDYYQTLEGRFGPSKKCHRAY